MKTKMSDFLSPLSDDPPERIFHRDFNRGDLVLHVPSGYVGTIRSRIPEGYFASLTRTINIHNDGFCSTPLYKVIFTGINPSTYWVREEELRPY